MHGHLALYNIPQFAFADPLTDLPEVGSEASVLMDHHADFAFDFVDNFFTFGQRVHQGLLT